MIPLPATLRRGLRSLVNTPRYGPVGLTDPQQLVDVFLEGLGAPWNVTRNNTVAALRPFTIGVMFDADSAPAPGGRLLHLCFRERGGSKRILGAFDVRMSSSVALPEHRFCLFQTSGGENQSVSTLGLRLYEWRERGRAQVPSDGIPTTFKWTRGICAAATSFISARARWFW